MLIGILLLTACVGNPATTPQPFESEQIILPTSTRSDLESGAWQAYHAAGWPISFEYSASWHVVEEREGDRQLSVLLQDEDASASNDLHANESAVIQLSFSYMSAAAAAPSQVLQSIMEEKSPERSGLFFDPDGTLEIEAYRSDQGVEGLLGSVQSDVYLHESFAFTHELNGQKTLGIVDAMARRPISVDDENNLRMIFQHLVDSIMFEQ